jgi:hypothetical protein
VRWQPIWQLLLVVVQSCKLCLGLRLRLRQPSLLVPSNSIDAVNAPPMVLTAAVSTAAVLIMLVVVLMVLDGTEVHHHRHLMCVYCLTLMVCYGRHQRYAPTSSS